MPNTCLDAQPAGWMRNWMPHYVTGQHYAHRNFKQFCAGKLQGCHSLFLLLRQNGLWRFPLCRNPLYAGGHLPAACTIGHVHVCNPQNAVYGGYILMSYYSLCLDAQPLAPVSCQTAHNNYPAAALSGAAKTAFGTNKFLLALFSVP